MPSREIIREEIVTRDCEIVAEKNATYKDSFAKRGGIGAFHMLARKWDRIENILAQPPTRFSGGGPAWEKDDIFEALDYQDMSTDDGKLLAEIQDLRRYLLLIEEYMAWRRQSQTTYGESNRQ